MNYRILGQTNIKVSEIGFGAWGIGGSREGAIGYGSTNDVESRKALRMAFDLGVTFFDTADLYGYGHSETLLGLEFKDCRNRVIIASKVGLVDHVGGQNFSVQHIKESINKSLKRLKTDYIDLYQLHNPPKQVIQDEAIWECFSVLKKSGKIRSVGISVQSPQESIFAIDRFVFEVVQVNFNMADQRAIQYGALKLCRKNSVGIIARTPLCFGFLTGQFSEKTSFDLHDHRNNWSLEQKECWARAPQLFKSGQNTEQQTEAQQALRYCLSYPEISTVIPGMLSAKEVQENVRASELGPLPETDVHHIENVYKNHTFFLR